MSAFAPKWPWQVSMVALRWREWVSPFSRPLDACANASFDDGIRIDTQLMPVGGDGAPVKPPVYEGGAYPQDKRWASPDDEEPTPVMVIDKRAVPGQPLGGRLATQP